MVCISTPCQDVSSALKNIKRLGLIVQTNSYCLQNYLVWQICFFKKVPIA